MQHFDLITVGRATVDTFLTIDESNKHFKIDRESKELTVRLGDKALVDRVDFLPGGNAANVAVGVSRLGFRTAVVAEIGKDEFAKKIRFDLEREKVDSSLLTSSGGETDFSVIINTAGDRTVFCQDLQREHDFHFSNVTSNWVYLTSLTKKWMEAYEKILEFCLKENIKIAFNPGTSQLDAGYNFLSKILKHTEILFVNKEEAGRIISSHNDSFRETENLLKKLSGLGVKTVVITDGDKGSHAYKDGIFVNREAEKTTAIERTGAGDGYASGFLAAYMKGLDVKERVDWGALNGAAVVEKIGAQAGLLRREQLISKLK